MKKARKSRAHSARIITFLGYIGKQGYQTVYYNVIPYDKKGKEIPSSVNCCYHAGYFDYDDLLTITQSL
jgi:hypothetical protein